MVLARTEYMLKQSLTPKMTAVIIGSFVLLCVVIVGGLRLRQTQLVKQEDDRMNWQRDREMGVPNLGLREGATEEEKEVARTKMLEKQLTAQRATQGY